MMLTSALVSAKWNAFRVYKNRFFRRNRFKYHFIFFQREEEEDEEEKDLAHEKWTLTRYYRHVFIHASLRRMYNAPLDRDNVLSRVRATDREGMRVALNNGRVINCSKSAGKLEVMDVVPRAPDAPVRQSIIARMQVAVRGWSGEDYRTQQKEALSKTTPGNKARTDSRVTHGKTSVFPRPTT